MDILIGFTPEQWQLIVDAALYVAEVSGDPEDCELAEQISIKVTVALQTVPHRNITRS